MKSAIKEEILSLAQLQKRAINAMMDAEAVAPAHGNDALADLGLRNVIGNLYNLNDGKSSNKNRTNAFGLSLARDQNITPLSKTWKEKIKEASLRKNSPEQGNVYLGTSSAYDTNEKEFIDIDSVDQKDILRHEGRHLALEKIRELGYSPVPPMYRRLSHSDAEELLVRVADLKWGSQKTKKRKRTEKWISKMFERYPKLSQDSKEFIDAGTKWLSVIEDVAKTEQEKLNTKAGGE